MFCVHITVHPAPHRIDTREVFDPRREFYTEQSSFDLSTFSGLLDVGVQYSVRMLAENDIGRGNYSEPAEFTCKFHVWY